VDIAGRLVPLGTIGDAKLARGDSLLHVRHDSRELHLASAAGNGSAGHPKTALVIAQPRLEKRHEAFDQLLPARIEMAQMAAMDDGVDARQGPQSVMPGTLEGDLMASRKCYRNRSAQRRLDPVVMAASKKTSRDGRGTLSSRPLSFAVQFLLDHFVSAKQDFLRYGILPGASLPFPLFRRMIRGVRYALLVVLVSAVTCARKICPIPAAACPTRSSTSIPRSRRRKSVPVRSIPRPSQCATRRHAKRPVQLPDVLQGGGHAVAVQPRVRRGVRHLPAELPVATATKQKQGDRAASPAFG